MSLDQAPIVSNVGVAGPTRGCRVGGPSAPRYFLTVARLIRNSRSIDRNDFPLAPGFLSHLPSLPLKQHRLARGGGCGLAGSGRTVSDGPLILLCPLTVSAVVREFLPSVPPSRRHRRAGPEHLRNARGRCGEIRDWIAPPGQRGCSLHAAPTAGRPVLPGPPPPPRA